MTQGYQQLQFESNQCNAFRTNRCHRRTGGGGGGRKTTDDGRVSIFRALYTRSSIDKSSRKWENTALIQNNGASKN